MSNYKNKIQITMKITILLTLFLSFIKIQAQEVNVNVFGKGKTEQEAIIEGLRNALNQTSTVFISSNVTLINDELTKDQTSMINNGSIESYKIVGISKVEDLTVVNLDVNVSVIKLTSFIENKGGTSELKGGLFAANIKLQELNEKAELNAIKDLIEVSQSILEKSFDYSIANGEPINKDGKWEIPLNVTISKNKNYDNFVNFFYQSIRKITMKSDEVKTYIKLQKPMKSIGLFDNSSVNYSIQTMNFGSIKTNEFGFSKKSESLNLLPTEGLRYYVRMKEGKDTLKYITNDKNKAKLFEAEWYKANNTYNGSAREGLYACENKFYIINDSSKFNILLFRNIESFNLISEFIKNLQVNIMNVNVSNGISSENINSLIEKKRKYERNLTFSFGTVFDANFLISFGYAYPTDATIYFLPYKPSGLIMCMENYAGYYDGSDYPKFSHGLLRNYNWEKSMSGENSNQMYFDFTFGNYFLYLSRYNKLAYYSNYSYKNLLGSFPLQLTLIGNEKGEVFKFELLNKVSTEEISKIKTYTISR